MASYVSPAVREQFETLSKELQDCILARDVRLENMHDMIGVLDQIVKESEG